MEEKQKTNISTIIIIILLTIIVILGSIYLIYTMSKDNLQANNQTAQSSQNGVSNQSNQLNQNNQDEQDNQLPNQSITPSTTQTTNQNTNQENFDETQSYDIELNGKTTKIEVGIKRDKEYQGEYYGEDLQEQKVYIEIRINGKRVPLEEITCYFSGTRNRVVRATIDPMIGINETIRISDVIEEVSTIKGEDNKSYIRMTIVIKDYHAHDWKYCYVIDENGNILGVFDYEIGGTVIVEDYIGNYLDVQEDCIIQYDIDKEDGTTLDKWKYTIKDGYIEKELVRKYTKDEFSRSRKEKITLYKLKYTIKDGKIEKNLERHYTPDEFSGAGWSI